MPKSCGGSNHKDNLVKLSLREHYVCHLLLVKMYKNTENYVKMLRASFMMTRGGNVNSRVYQKIKEEHINHLKKQSISESQKNAISKANKNNKARSGHKNTDEHNELIRIANMGRKVSDKTREIWSKQRKGKIPWNKGLTGTTKNYPKKRKSKGSHSPETIEKMRIARIAYHKSKKEILNV